MRDISIHIDKWGIDPLKDAVALKVERIQTFTPIKVSEDLEHNAVLISSKFYSRPDLDFVILEYNSLGHEREIVKGMTLKLPDLSQVLALLSETKRTSTSTTSRSAVI